MRDDKSKDEVELLGGYLRDRAPSVEEERLVLDRVWQEIGSTDLPTTVRHDFRRKAFRTAAIRYAWIGAAAACVAAVAVLAFFARSAPPAFVEIADGSLERLDGGASRLVLTGDSLFFGEVVRTGSSARTVLTLTDGSQVEMRANSALSLEKADDGLRVRLDSGGVFIKAAKQRQGHLYVKTKEVTVTVVGTVFLVSAEEAGSRVAVVEGEVRVQQGEKTSSLLPGEQMATNPLMTPHLVVEQLAWSRSAEPYLLQQPKPLEFETAKLRLITDQRGRFASRPRCRGIDGELRPVGPTAPVVPLGRCVGETVFLTALVEAAYDAEGVNIQGLPNLVEQPFYQLEARAEDPTKATREDLRQMLQNFIVEQLKLKVHRETKEMDGYVLTIAKSGVKFQEASGDEELIHWEPSGLARADLSEQALPTNVKGKFRFNRFVSSLSAIARVPIIDKTGLTGLYDMTFSIELILPAPPAAGPGLRGGGGDGPARPQDFNPPLAKALEDQLGIHLERSKVPVEYLLVDSYEKEPSSSQ
jgi:uncharacterized protein (TIGR03435 family)